MYFWRCVCVCVYTPGAAWPGECPVVWVRSGCWSRSAFKSGHWSWQTNLEARCPCWVLDAQSHHQSLWISCLPPIKQKRKKRNECCVNLFSPCSYFRIITLITGFSFAGGHLMLLILYLWTVLEYSFSVLSNFETVTQRKMSHFIKLPKQCMFMLKLQSSLGLKELFPSINSQGELVSFSECWFL